MATFARILTDYLYRVLILHMIVEASPRNRGLGRVLMEAIIDHPSLKSVGQLDICCLSDMMPFYRKWGFTEDLGGPYLLKRMR
ncbi:MAG: GNAT family N-acetyltransferase [Candidatus Thermoplasmatota archaeon]|nr:GNAT family N-acetyltransferase [Candidatus Thermoplasmatota archaeon]